MRIGIIVTAICVCGNVSAEAPAPSGQKLKGSEIYSIFAGHTISFVRQKSIAANSTPENPRFVVRPHPIKVVYYFRSDGSWSYQCTVLAQVETPCTNLSTNIGVWEVRGDTVCLNSIKVRRETAACYEVIQISPKRIWTRLVNNMPSSEDGPGDIQ